MKKMADLHLRLSKALEGSDCELYEDEGMSVFPISGVNGVLSQAVVVIIAPKGTSEKLKLSKCSQPKQIGEYLAKEAAYEQPTKPAEVL